MRLVAADRVALINPNRLDESDEGAAHGHLAAVGMAFLLGVALLRELRARGRFGEAAPEPTIIDLLDLVALGTVADVAKLKSLNRAFVTQGLKVMAGRATSASSRWPRRRGWSRRRRAATSASRSGPRINAGGRVGKSDLGVRLLTADRPRGSARHRRRARPPQRGTPRDRDAGPRTGRRAGRGAGRRRR